MDPQIYPDAPNAPLSLTAGDTGARLQPIAPFQR